MRLNEWERSREKEGMDERPDEDLILEYQSGKDEALTMIFQRYKKPVLNFALRLLGNRADAEDATGEVFLVLFAKKYTYQPTSKFSTWLYTVTRNVCVSRLRKRKWTVSLFVKRDEQDSPQEWDIPDTSNLPSDELDKKEAAHTIKKAIEKLPDLQKEALILREYQGMSYQEISNILDCSLEKVKILIYRARERLRDELPSFIKEGNHE